MTSLGCTDTCWTEQYCEVCRRPIPPAGRSVPLEAAGGFCEIECGGYPKRNLRHLWSVHDDVRFYTDPVGWAQHVANCEQCKGEE